MRHFLMLGVVATWTATGFCDPPRDAVDRITGEWWLVETADQRQPDPGSEECVMVLSPDRKVVLRVGALTTNQGTFRVDGAFIDMELATGTVLARFAVQDGDLVLCCDFKDNGRPDTMTPMGTQWLERWRRVVR